MVGGIFGGVADPESGGCRGNIIRNSGLVNSLTADGPVEKQSKMCSRGAPARGAGGYSATLEAEAH